MLAEEMFLLAISPFSRGVFYWRVDMKSRSITRIICEVAIFAAIGFVLDEIQGAFSVSFTAGGSIGIAMVAVLIVAYRRGLLPAIATGLIMGALDLATKAYILHPLQVFLDYIFPYMFVGLAGLFKPLFDKSNNHKYLWLAVGTIVGGTLKFFSHYFAGLFYWNVPEQFAWNLSYMSPALYSFVYNLAYVGPCVVLSVLVLLVIYKRAPQVLDVQEEKNKEEVKKPITTEKFANFMLVGTLFTVGTILFVVFFVRYILTHTYDEYTWIYGYEIDSYFDGDCMVKWISGLALIGIGVNHLVMTIKNKIKYEVLCLVSGVSILAVCGYVASRIIKMYFDVYIEGKSPERINNAYWIWFVALLIVGLNVLVLAIYLYKKKQKDLAIISAN